MNNTLKEPPPSGSFGALLMGKRINSTKSGTKVQDPLRNHHNTNAAFCSKHRTSSVIVSTPKPPRLNPELYNNLVNRFVPPSPLANTPLTGVKVNIKSKHKHQLLWLNPTAQENEPTRTKSSLCMGVNIGPLVFHSSKNTREVKPTKNNFQVSLKHNDVKEPVALLCVDCLSIKKEPMRVKFQSHEYVPLEVVGEQLKKECAPSVAKSDLRLERVYDVLTPNSPEPVAPAPAKTPRLPATKKSEKRIYHQGLSPSGASYAVCSHAPVKVRDKKVPPTLTMFHVHRIQFDPKVTNRRYVDVATLFDAFLTSPIDTLSISEITSSTKPKRKTNKRSKQLSHIIHAKKPLTTPSRHSNTSENPNKDKNKQTENPTAKNPDNLFKFPDGTFYCEKMLEKLVRMKRLAELTAKQRSATTPRKKQGRHYLEDLIQKSRAQDSDTHAPNVTLQNVADPALTKRTCAENDTPKEQTSSTKKTSASRKRSSKPVTIINTKSETDEFQFESLSTRQMDDSVICQTDGSTLYNTLSYADSSVQHCTETLSTASTAVSPIPSQISTEQKLKPDINITPGDQTIDSISASDSRFEKPCDVSLSQYELQAESEASCDDSCSQDESVMDDGDSTSRTRHVTSPANHVIRIPHLPLDDYDNDYWSMSNCKVNDHQIPSLNVTGDYQNHSHDEINTYRTPLHIETNDNQNLPLNEVNDHRKPSHIEINDHQIPSHNEINDHQNHLRNEINDHQIPSHNEINDHQNHLRNEINDHQSLSCNADNKSTTPYLASHSLCLSRSSRSLRTQEPTSTIVSSCLVSDITRPRHQTCLEKNAMSHHLPHICSKTSSSRLISSSNEFSACVNNANLMTGEVMSNLLRDSLVNSSAHSPSGWASTSLHPPTTLVNSSLHPPSVLVNSSLHPPSVLVNSSLHPPSLLVNSSLHTTPGLVSASLHPPCGLVRQGHIKPNKNQIQTSESSKSLPQHQNSTLINGKTLRRFNSVEMKDSTSEKYFDHAENKGANEAEVMRDAVGPTHDSVERVSSLLDSCDANSVRSQGVRSSVVKCGCGSLSSRRLVDEVSTVLDDGVTADTLTEADVTTDVGGEDGETLADVDVTVVEGGASMMTLAETDVMFKEGCVAVDTLREVGVPTEDDEASAGLIAEVDVMKERNELTGSTLELNGLAGSQAPELTRSEVPRSGLPGSGLSRSGLSGSGLDHKQDQQLLTDEPHFKQKNEIHISDIESTQRSTTFFVNEQHTEEKQPPLDPGFNQETTLSSDVINEQPIASEDKLHVTSQNPHELSLPPPHPDHHLNHLDPTHLDPTQPDPTHPNPTQPGTTTSYMSCSQTSQRSGQNVSICSSRDETCTPDSPDHLKHHHHRAPTPHGIISTEVSQTNLYDNYSLSQIDLNRKNITFSSDVNNFVSEDFLEYLNSLPSRGISKCNLQIPSVYAKLDRREYPPGPVRRLEPLGCGDGLLERSSCNRTCLVAYHPLLPARVASPGHQGISITGRTVFPDIRGASQTRPRHQDVQYSICGRCRTGGVQHHGIVPQYLASSYSTSPHCTSHYRAL